MEIDYKLKILATTKLILTLIFNYVANKIVIKYYQKKPPGHQSLVDFFYIDFLRIYSLVTPIYLFSLSLGKVHFEYIKQYENAHWGKQIRSFRKLSDCSKMS